MKKQLIKIKLNSLYGNHVYKGDVKNKDCVEINVERKYSDEE